jgi:dephospho-CoA kinase
MLVIGLTGGLAMGKSTVAAMFAEAGVAVFNADRAVHALYGGRAVPAVEAAFRGTTTNGTVDRQRLGKAIAGNPAALARLEAIVHPLVREAEDAFKAVAAQDGRRVVLFDIPLLFETGSDRRVDAIVVVSTSADLQRQRLKERGMGDAESATLIARQMPDAEKRRRAHFVIDTGTPLEATRDQVSGVLRALGARAATR